MRALLHSKLSSPAPFLFSTLEFFSAVLNLLALLADEGRGERNLRQWVGRGSVCVCVCVSACVRESLHSMRIPLCFRWEMPVRAAEEESNCMFQCLGDPTLNYIFSVRLCCSGSALSWIHNRRPVSLCQMITTFYVQILLCTVPR